MVCNFDKIVPMLNFGDDRFYYIQILNRGKDNGSKKDKVIDSYYVDNYEYLERKYPEMKQICDDTNSRLTIRLEYRTYKDVTFEMLKNLTDIITSEQYPRIKRLLSSATGKKGSDKDKKWILDIDEDMVAELDNIITYLETITYIHTILESKTGYHIIVRGFNPNDFCKKYPLIEIKKGTYTNMYIP